MEDCVNEGQFMRWTQQGHLTEAYLIVSKVMHWEGNVCIMGHKNTVRKFCNRKCELSKKKYTFQENWVAYSY